MSTFQPANNDVRILVDDVIRGTECHKWMTELGLKIDLVMAYGARNDDGELIGDAIRHHGVKALGLCRIIPLKDRAMGRGDAEITFDGDEWESLPEPQKVALADHELEHLKLGKGIDDLGRPKLKLRKHDHQFGFFMSVAKRHRMNSQECIQAKSMMELGGQYYWPLLADALHSNDQPTQRFQNIASEIGKEKK